MMSNQEKVWGKGIYAKLKTFQNGGTVTEVSLKIEEAIPFLQQHAKQSGYVNLKIYGSREPRMDDNGNEKLNVELDTWEPTRSNVNNSQSDYNTQQAPQPQYQQQIPQAPQAPQQPAMPQQPLPQNNYQGNANPNENIPF